MNGSGEGRVPLAQIPFERMVPPGPNLFALGQPLLGSSPSPLKILLQSLKRLAHLPVGMIGDSFPTLHSFLYPQTPDSNILPLPPFVSFLA